MKKIIFLACTLLASFPVFAEDEVKKEAPTLFSNAKYQLDISFESLDYLFNRDDYDINDQEKLDITLALLFDNEKNFKVDLKPRLRLSLLDSNLNRYQPNEAYFLYYTPHFEFSGGFQMIGWGSSNSFNPTDVLNRVDLEENFYDSEKLGDVIFSAKGTFDKLGPLTNISIEGLVMPLFLETPMPENNSRFAFSNTIYSVTFTKDDESDLPDTFWDSLGLAANLKATYKWLDGQLLFYRGPEHLPAFFVSVQPSGIKLKPSYYTIDMFGANFQASWKQFVFHFEGAYKRTGFDDHVVDVVPFDKSDAIPNNYFQFVPGVDYTIDGLFKGPGSLKLSLEYLGDSERKSGILNFRPFRNDIFLGAHYDVNDAKLTMMEIAFIKDLDNEELAIIGSVTRKLYKELKLEIQGAYIIQDELNTEPLSFFENKIGRAHV